MATYEFFNNVKAPGLNVEGITSFGSTTPATFSAAGLLDINNATTSTTTTSGALQVAGGAGIVENLNVGGTVNIGTTISKHQTGFDMLFAGVFGPVAWPTSGLTLAGSKAGTIYIKVEENDNGTADKFAYYTMECINKSIGGNAWESFNSFIGDVVGVTFTILATGVLNYESTTVVATSRIIYWEVVSNLL